MANGRTAGMPWDYERNKPRMPEMEMDARINRGQAIPTIDRACVRCVHYRRGEMDATGTHLCERPQLGKTRDLVIGVDVPNTRDAHAERRNGGEGSCGPEGKFWQQSGF